MNISLTPELDQFVRQQVETGLYLSASEVIRDALRLLKEREQLRQIRLEELRKLVAEGIAELDRGEKFPIDDVFRELRGENPPDPEGQP